MASRLAQLVFDLLDGGGFTAGGLLGTGSSTSPFGTPPFNPATAQPKMPDIDLPTAVLAAETIIGRGKGAEKFRAVLSLLVPVLAARVGLPVAIVQTLGGALIDAVVKRMNDRGELPKDPPPVVRYLPDQSYPAPIPPDAEILEMGYRAEAKEWVYVSLDGTGWGVGEANHLPIDGYKPHHKLSGE